jgi:hypothetical protein
LICHALLKAALMPQALSLFYSNLQIKDGDIREKYTISIGNIFRRGKTDQQA